MADSQVITSLRAEEVDLTPLMVRSPKIVQDLTICTAIAFTKEIARIRLNTFDSSLTHDDLPSNMIEVVNKGHKAFLRAYGALHYISAVTEEMGRDNGLLHKVQRRFGDPAAQLSLDRLFDNLQKRVEESKQRGLAVYQDFEKFSDFITELRKSLAAAESDTVRKLDATEKQIENGKIERDFDRKVMQHKEQEKAEAEEQFKRIFGTFERRENMLGSFMGATIGSAALVPIALASGMVGVASGLVASCVAGGMISSAAEKLGVAEQRLDEKRQAYREFELKMAYLEGQLESLGNSKNRLDESKKIISDVLNLLSSLAADIGSLLIYFITTNNAIGELTQANSESGKIFKTVRQSVLNGETANQYDCEDFVDAIVKMRKEAMIVNTLSSLYGCVIKDVVNPAFGRLLTDAKVDSQDQDVATVIETKRSLMRSYVENAEKSCRVKVAMATKQLAQRLASFDTVA